MKKKIVQLSNALNTLQNPDIHPKIKNEFLKVIINNIYYTRKNDNRTRNDDSPFTIKIILNL